MLKRPVIACIISLAFIMLQAHNFIPHHHQDDRAGRHSHQHDQGEHHSHDTDNEENGNSEDTDAPFQAAGHHSDFGKLIIKPQEKSVTTIQWADMEADISRVFAWLFVFEIPPPNLPPSQNETVLSTTTGSSPSLRGPPAFIVEA